MKNLLGSLQKKLSGYGDIVIRGEKFTRDLDEKRIILSSTDYLMNIFILIQDFGLKNNKRKK